MLTTILDLFFFISIKNTLFFQISITTNSPGEYLTMFKSIWMCVLESDRLKDKEIVRTFLCIWHLSAAEEASNTEHAWLPDIYYRDDRRHQGLESWRVHTLGQKQATCWIKQRKLVAYLFFKQGQSLVWLKTIFCGFKVPCENLLLCIWLEPSFHNKTYYANVFCVCSL